MYRLLKQQVHYYKDRLKIISIEELLHRGLRKFAVALERIRIAVKLSEWAELNLRDHILPLEMTSSHNLIYSRGPAHHKSSQTGCSNLELKNRLWQEFRSSGFEKFYFRWKDRDEILYYYSQIYPDRISGIKEKADRLCNHIIPIFEHPFVFAENIPWHHDPLTKRPWPLQYSPWINLRDETNSGGIKWVWELNRQQHLITLAKAYFLTEDERYAKEVSTQIYDWITHNPPLFGVNWISALECAIRLISWIWSLHFIRGSEMITSDFTSEVFGSIYQQTRFIETHLSTFSSANNHLIGEATALSTVGLCFPWFRRARIWLTKGISLLNGRLTEQILPDGVFSEQSIHYGRYVIDFYISVLLLLKTSGMTPPTMWYEQLTQAGRFLLYLKDAKGNVPNIGDHDGGQAYLLCEQEDFNPSESILTTLALVMEKPDFKLPGRKFDEKTFWLLGPAGWKQYGVMENLPLKLKSRVFQGGGYSVFRNSKSLLTFDCGSLGDKYHAAHGHADALSITLSVNGIPLLVDPGMPYYQENIEMRNYFRGTMAHNTVVIDAQNQSTIGDVFMWLKKADARIKDRQFSDEYEYIEAEHNGFRRIGVIHRRLIISVKDPNWDALYIVRDLLEGVGTHHVCQLWHFSPTSKLELNQKDGSAIIREEDTCLNLFALQSFPLKAQQFRGNTDPILGWFSSSYGTLIESSTLIYQGIVDLPLRLNMIMGAYTKTN